jgi:AraC-like DNA-binding protein
LKVHLEQVSHHEQSFRVLQLALPAFRGAWHRHPQVELTWIESGQGLRFIGDDVAPFADGDLVLLGPNLPHVWLSPPEQEGRPHRTTVLQFRADLFAVTSVPEWLPVQALLARAASGLTITGPCKAQVVERLRRMPGESDLVRLSLLLEVLGILTQNPQCLNAIASRLSAGAFATDSRIETLIPWIQNELHRPLGITEAAKRVHISPAAFSRFFRNNMGKAFTVYVNDMRCAEACMQLQTTKKSVAQIAEACGFQTLSHFNRQFRLRHGLTPRAFRKGSSG